MGTTGKSSHSGRYSQLGVLSLLRVLSGGGYGIQNLYTNSTYGSIRWVDNQQARASLVNRTINENALFSTHRFTALVGLDGSTGLACSPRLDACKVFAANQVSENAAIYDRFFGLIHVYPTVRG